MDGRGIFRRFARLSFKVVSRLFFIAERRIHLFIKLQTLPICERSKRLLIRYVYTFSLSSSEVWRPNSLTLLFVSAYVFSWSRMVKRSQHSYPTMVVSITLKKTMKFSCPDSDDQDTPSEIFQVYGSRLWRSPTFHYWHCSRERRNDQDHKFLFGM